MTHSSKQYSPRVSKRHTFLLLPLLVFLVLRYTIDQESIVWGISWYTRAFQFYIGSLSSLIAIIVALFSTNVFKANNPRATFFFFAFTNVSALLLVSSVTTPGVIFDQSNRLAFEWSLRLAFFVGACSFLLATLHWQKRPHISRFFTPINVGLVSLGAFLVYLFAIFAKPSPFMLLESLNPLLAQLLAIFTAVLYLLTAYRILNQRWNRTTRIDNKLPSIFVLLAEAAVFQAFGVYGGYSWLLHNPIVIAALGLAVYAILDKFESSKEVQLSRYFAVVGSIVVGITTLVFTELGRRWIEGVTRAALVPLILAQSIVSFLILFAIVYYLSKLIRERKEALDREQYLRNELTQLIVHDLKSPLSVITSGINLLAKGHLGDIPPKQQRLLTNLEGSGKQILSMINDLLDVERLESGALTVQSLSVNMQKLVQESVEKFKIIADTNSQTLQLDSTSLLYDTKGDKKLLQRVLHNLLSNALKFTPENGRIHITLSNENNHLVVRIADDGPGIPLVERERIFEKFAQVDRVERRGAGLGLTFCKMVAEAHKGFLYAEESSMGGAQFVLGLPLPNGNQRDNSATPAAADLRFESL